MLLSSLVALSLSQDTEITPRMPMHRTQGIFDLLPPSSIFKALGKFLRSNFRKPLRLLKSAVKPLMHYARIAWSWVGQGTTVPGMTQIGGRSIDINSALDFCSDENIDAFFGALEI